MNKKDKKNNRNSHFSKALNLKNENKSSVISISSKYNISFSYISYLSISCKAKKLFYNETIISKKTYPPLPFKI